MLRLIPRLALRPPGSPLLTLRSTFTIPIPTAITSPFRTMSTTIPSTSPLSQPVKIALIQLLSTSSKADNLRHARSQVLQAAHSGGAHIVVLPECFNAPYGCEYFDEYAEPIPTRTERGENGEKEIDKEKYHSYSALRDMARDAGVYLIAGSIPERSPRPPSQTSNPDDTEAKEKATRENKKDYFLYNTSLTFSPTGSPIGLHRKIHLFDIDIPGKITFTESSVLSPGHTPTLINLPPYGTIGVQICYDIRFPELTTIYARKGAFAVIVPGAFNLTTGPLHWELLARARANDNQVYVAVCSPARTPPEQAGYKAWGESMLIDPMGRVVGKVDGGEAGIVYAQLTPEGIDEARAGIPVTRQRRWDVYPNVAGEMEVSDGLELVEQ